MWTSKTKPSSGLFAHQLRKTTESVKIFLTLDQGFLQIACPCCAFVSTVRERGKKGEDARNRRGDACNLDGIIYETIYLLMQSPSCRSRDCLGES